MNSEDLIREIESRYRLTGRSFNEFQRRIWAASEALKLGRGGIAIVSRALRISPNTIRRGIQELEDGKSESIQPHRIRKPGGGRKAKPPSDEKAARPDFNQVAGPGESESPVT